MRKKLYQIINAEQENSQLSRAYDIIMIIVILLSIAPLAFKRENTFLIRMDLFTVVIFIFDYFVRFATADFKFPDRKRVHAFLYYPFSPFAIIDLLSILPSLTLLNDTLRLLRLLRLARSLRLLRVFKFLRYSKSLEIFYSTIRKQKDALTLVGGLTLAYILISALLVFNVEPESFSTFFDALYWSTSALTTVTFGDVYPVSDLGRFVSMISSLVGVIVIALPSSIITAGYIEELESHKEID